MKLFLPLAVFFTATATGTSVHAEPPPVPSPPFVIDTPQSGAWQIDISGPAPAVPQGDSLPTVDGKPVKIIRPVSVAVRKTGDVVCEEWSYSDGSKTERWAFRGAQIEQLPGSSELFRRIPDMNSFDLFNYRQKEFPHFWWLKAANFRGVQTLAGRPCNLFHDTILVGGPPVALPMGESPPAAANSGDAELYVKATPVVAVAWIDQETMQPVQIKIGSENRTYKFSPAPPGRLMPPGNVKAELDGWIGSIERANRPHKSP